MLKRPVLPPGSLALALAWCVLAGFAPVGFAPLGFPLAGGPTRVMAQAPAVNAEFFERQIRPLLVDRCHKCHSATKARGGLRLDQRDLALKGGETGPALVPGKPAQSLLLQAVEQTGGLKMPPDGRLKESELTALRTWIAAGAPWPAGEAAPHPDGTSPAAQDEPPPLT
ncbi:MAG: c-type cytochrome domain-containing protein, partial [Planctomycetaceae bacterium]